MAISDDQIRANRRISALEEEQAQLRACVALLDNTSRFYSQVYDDKDVERLRVRYEERLEEIGREIDLVEIARDHQR
jgi:hypothetical protein